MSPSSGTSMPRTATEQAAAGPPRRSLGRRLARIASVLLLTLIAAVSVAGIIGYWMWQGVPDYWEEAQRLYENPESAEADEMAEELENRTSRELSSVSPRPRTGDDATPPTRTLHLSYQRMNAWLARRLELWLANQDLALPEAIERPMVTRTGGGELVLAFRARLPELEQVMSIVFDVEVLEDGQARLHWRRTLVGRLPLPSQWVREQVVEHMAEQGAAEQRPRGMMALRDVLDGEPFDPLIPVDGTRHARVIGVSVGESGVDLTLRIESRATASAAADSHAPPIQ